MAASANTSTEKLTILKRFIYEPGPWNEGRAFAYDLADPLGKNPANRMLSHYVKTRLGNCVTMPVLFVVLGRSIGLKLTLSTAPLHIFVKYTDDDGAIWNLEPTSGGGFTRDSHYIKQLPMTDLAITNGVYLATLSHAQSVAVLTDSLISHYLTTGQPENAILTADIALKSYPNNAPIMVKRASAFYLILKRDVLDQHNMQNQGPASSLGLKGGTEISADVKAQADALYAQNQSGFTAAESLGWRETDGIIPAPQSPPSTGTPAP